MTVRVELNPELISWAIERSGIERRVLKEKFPKLDQWEEREKFPTLKQLESFAKKVHVPIGYLLLSEPPVENLPIPDFRTLPGNRNRRPSPNLLDTIYLCQQRQNWYREFAIEEGEEPLKLVGSLRIGDDVVKSAEIMRNEIKFNLEDRKKLGYNEDDYLRNLSNKIEEAGVLVMISGTVGINPNRPLDVDEFRGFALSDQLAPLIFVNGKDAKAAQIFTMAHELAHVFTGNSSLSDATTRIDESKRDEVWCNKVAAEFLVPAKELIEKYNKDEEFENELTRLRKSFKVSKLVIIRRLYDLKAIDRKIFEDKYKKILSTHCKVSNDGSGGNFYNKIGIKTSEKFVKALVTNTFEGCTSFTDSFRLLGFWNIEKFKKIGAKSHELI